MKEDTIVGGLDRFRSRWAILGSVALLIATICVGIWLAFAVEAPTIVTVDQQEGTISIEGPEREFAGLVTGNYEGSRVTIAGLPVIEELIDNPIAWRAFCAVRADEAADWSQATPSLRGYLNSRKIDNLCEPYS